ncbi:MAG TPA: 50S ribosomal protein L4 [Gemmatimonadales bacterium]|jgi:large subunit ribosomal protein L4|uniref:Large ribosomal subunit protein uL4 n=1 Tax=uncultured Gemmatimonadetes bacterium Rifle_16ft_4_minimus_1650 TaxID=1665094 RepID=A0A0H4T4J0_9BACT|nr:50S ribosomal protein L4, large subunit ribosomal protein L4 [uncultured Gemmatimonadetes bacterium Rifle_16ft_4_minimus_1650]HLB38332.1 50S ribosomal protein L4 [Gemmatimonadales bacterium]
MLEALHFTAAGQRKGSHQLPAEYDGVVNQAVLHQAVRTYRNNQRHGTAATKTRGFVSGGNQKPWRQKGTGRARQGSTRAAQWPGGGTVFGPMPRSYRTDINRKVRQLARRSALNARAAGGQIYVIEQLEFEKPKTSQMASLLEKLELSGRKVLVLTDGHRPEVYRSGRNIPDLEVMAYRDAAAYDVLWADAVVVEEAAVGGQAVAGKATTARAKRAERAAQGAARPKAAAKQSAAKAKSAKPKKPSASKKKGTE